MKRDATKRPAACPRFVALLMGVLLLAGCATSPGDINGWAAADGTNALPRIEPELYSPKPAVRQAALDALLSLPPTPEIVKALTNATLSPDAAIRGQAGAAMVLNANGDLDFFAITLLADPDATVRRQMAQGLTAAGHAGPSLRTERAAIYLWGLTKDTDDEVRAAAAEGSATLGQNDPIDFALDALRHDPEPRVRAAAARGLGQLSQPYLAGSPTALRSRGEEIVAALGEAARNDAGQYIDIRFDQTLVFTRRFEETHWVAAAAAEALTVPNQIPRPDVAAALVAAKLRLPLPPPPAPRLPKFHLPGSSIL